MFVVVDTRQGWVNWVSICVYFLSHIIKALLDKCEVKLNVTSPHVSDLAGSLCFSP